VGNTGSGKTTLAAELARRLECQHVELDALSWEADWQQAPLDVLRDRVARATRALWNDNREDFRSQFPSADSLLLWALNSHFPRRRRYAGLVNDPAFAHLEVVRLRTPHQARKWLNGEDVDT